jgi:hypothetical protein
MNKDVIYVDVEDDITAIITKVKESKESIVALVPPKRIGVLQSVVNLRILMRVSKASHKRLVLISNDQSLQALASAVQIPVAKNLQSKPTIPVIPALKIDDGDDIIDGSQLPVGDHADSVQRKRNIAVNSIDISDDGDEKTPNASYAKPPRDGDSPKRLSKLQKVPNFNKFRKKLLIIGALLVALIAFLIWAIWFAPQATVIISAQTHPEKLSTSVTLVSDANTDTDKGVIRAVMMQEKQEASIDFNATGTKEEGEASSGTMTISKSSPGDKEIPIGTGFSNGDCTFVTTKEVTVPGASPGPWNGSGFPTIAGKIDVGVKATDLGEQCNLSGRSYDPTINGVSAEGDDMAGGSKRTIRIVTQADVQKAAEELVKKNTDDVKEVLKKKFAKGTNVIDGSFTANRSDAVATPQVGQEVSGSKAKLTSSVTFSMTGVETSELKSFLESALKSKIPENEEQRIYEAGEATAKFTEFAANEKGGTVTLTAEGQVGPKIDDNDIKNRVKGKRFGDIQADLQSISGVKDVSVELFPFWVKTVPSDTSRIGVKFNLQSNGN